MASQAGHAFLNSYLSAPKEIQKEYRGEEGIGTKVCLECPNLGALIRCHQQAQELGLPSAYIVDTGNNGFDGVPTATALGIGPVTKAQAPFLKKFQLHK